MAENDKHRARFFPPGDSSRQWTAWESAVKDDRLTGTPRELSNSLGNLWEQLALLAVDQTDALLQRGAGPFNAMSEIRHRIHTP